MKWMMREEDHSTEMVTPEEEREMRFPVREQPPPSRNFTPLQMVILFLQFCLIGIFLGAIITLESTPKDLAPSPKYLVVTVEREKKVGGGFKYRLVSGNKGSIDAIIMESLPSSVQLGSTDASEVSDMATVVHWMSSSTPPLKITTQKEKVPNSPRQTITKEVSMPSPPVPPPWPSRAPPGPVLSRVTTMKQINKVTTTRAPLNFNRRRDFFRG